MNLTGRNWKKRLSSALLTLVLVAVLLPAGGFVTPAEAGVTTTGDWTLLSGDSSTGDTIGTDGKTTYYYITANRSFTNSTAGGSGLTIAGTVYLYIPSGVTLTATGAAASGTTGGGAGIHVPSGATLYLFGDGTVKATGGAAAKGATGGNGSASVNAGVNGGSLTTSSGAGGAGGGGAGAGIGTPGGTGGNTRTGVQRTETVNSSTATGTLRAANYMGLTNGIAGTSADDCGTIYKSSSLNVSGVKGGDAAAANTVMGSPGTNRSSGIGSSKYICASGGGAGGTGGSGLAGAAFGTGGGGGGGGQNGGTGLLYLMKGGTQFSVGTNGGNGAGNGQTAGTRGGAAGNAATSVTPGTTSGPSYTVTYTPKSGTATTATYYVGSNTSLKLATQTAGYAWKLTTYGKSCGSTASIFAQANNNTYSSNSSIQLVNVYGNLAFGPTPITYYVKYDLNGGTGSTPTQTTAAYDVVFEMPTCSATKTGYTFAGWSTSKTATSASYTAGKTYKNLTTTSGGTVTLYAVWAEKTATLTYNANGHGTAPSNVTMKYTAATNAAAAISATGYTFNGWNTNASGTGTNYAAGAQVKAANVVPSNITLYAKWTANQYTITYKDQGGGSFTGTHASGYPTKHTYGTATTLKNPTKTGYTFGGWFANSNCTGTALTSLTATTYTANITLYAKWTVNTYNIYYKDGGGGNFSGTHASGYPTTHTYGTWTDLDSPTKTGYTFGGWWGDSGCAQRQYTYISEDMMTNDFTFYAKWTPISYTIDYKDQGGGNFTGTHASGSPSKHTYGTATTLKTASKPGYTFGGWFTSSACTGSAVTSLGATNYLENPVLYAKWTANTYTVTFDRQSGADGSDNVTATFGSAMPSATMPTRTGYTFAGYYDATSGGNMYYKANGSSNANWDKTSNTVLYARWTANKYTITFNANGGNGTAPGDVSATYDANVTMPANQFTKTGYTFDGWNTSSNGNGTTYAAGTTATPPNVTATNNGSVTLWAKWKPITYTVTFNKNGGGSDGLPKDMTLTYDEAFSVPMSYPNKSWCTFSCWTTNADGTGTVFAPGENKVWNLTATDGDTVTLYAQFTEKVYTFHFDANGGENAPEDISCTYAQVGSTLAPGGATYAGYTLIGWGDMEGHNWCDVGTPMTNLIGVDTPAEQTLYAVWKLTDYYITLDLQGGTSESPGPLRVQVGNDLLGNSYNFKLPTRTGYTFVGFYDQVNGGGKQYIDENKNYTSWDKNEDGTLYAYWTANAYTVAFNANGGDGAPGNVEATYDEAFTLPTTEPTREGYVFAGWNTSSTGAGTTYAAGEEVLNLTARGTYTFYAKWTVETYDIIYKDEGGLDFSGTHGPDAPTTHTYDTATALVSPTKTGYTFAGWFAASDCSGSRLTSLAATGYTADITLYAKWTVNTATLTYYANGHGTPPQAVTMKYTETVNAAAAITAEGYTFAEWNTKADGAGTSYAAGAELKAANVDPEDIALYAQWTVNTYEIIYKDEGGSDFSGTHGSNAPTTHTYDTATALVSPTRTGYTFAGWYTDADCTESITVLGATDYTESPVVYAKWTVNTATLTYYSNGHGVPPHAVTMKYTETVNAASAITAEGYTFTGWNTQADGAGTSYAAGAELKAANVTLEDIALYAQWTVNTYTVKLDNGEGTGDVSVTVTYDEPMPEVTVPEQEQKVFGGYYDAPDGEGTMYYGKDGTSTVVWKQDDEEVTLYAYWRDSIDIELWLLLDGDTGMNFSVAFNDDELRETLPEEGGYIKLSIGGNKPKEKTIPFSEIEPDKDGRYVCVYNVNALQMAEDVTITVCDANKKVYGTKSVSVEGYYNRVKEIGVYGERNETMLKALVNYGYYAQQALGAQDYKASTQQNVPITEPTTLTAYQTVTNGSSDHVTKLNVSLLLNNKTSLCMYFTTKDKEMPKVTVDGGAELTPIVYGEEEAEFAADGTPLNIEEMSDGRWLVRISNIDALHLTDIHKVIADGKIIYVSAMSYGAATSGENAKAICALYDYYKAALACVNAEEILPADTSVMKFDYTGKVVEPDLTVKMADGTETDEYTVEWDGDLTQVGKYCGLVESDNGAYGGQVVRVSISQAGDPAVPTAVTGLVYNGTEQTGVKSGANYTLTGDYTATNAGTYTATATLDEGYCWADDTTEPKTIEWSIAKATPTPKGDISITYYLDGQMDVRGEMNVEGSFSFESTPTDGTNEALFTPRDTQNYETVKVSVDVTVAKKDAVEYMDWDDSAKELVEKKTTDWTEVTNNTTTLDAGKFYVVKGSNVQTKSLTVNGTEGSPTWLILTDGAKLTAKDEEGSDSAGINVASDKALIITGQSGGTGMLFANANNETYTGGAGIGGGNGDDGGSVTINGGKINAHGGDGGAGIGGGYYGDGGTVTINGGEVTATGYQGTGIGGGWSGDGGDVTINGGTVNAIGDWAAGIGGGDCGNGGNGGDGGTVTINGGSVTAICNGERGAGIGGGYGGDGGTVTITGGEVTANGGECAAGIGGGDGGDGGSVTVTGGTVKATSGSGGAGIGGGGDSRAGCSVTITGGTVEAISTDDSEGIDSKNKSVTISGGEVTATGGYEGIDCSGGSITITGGKVNATGSCGAGICCSGGTLTIDDGVVTAASGSDGAGIGGSHSGDGGSITINGGTVTAKGGSDAAGIGGGIYGSGGTITITGGTVNATGGYYSAGIGGGTSGGSGTVTITGGVITATGGENGAGIGCGGDGYGGSVTITGGTVDATADWGGAGIGCGNCGSGVTLTIDGGVINATGGDWGAGIGGGVCTNGISVTINGGEIIATGGDLGTGIGSGYFEDEDEEGEDGTVTFGEGVFFTVMAGDRAPGTEVAQDAYAASHDQAYVHIEPATVATVEYMAWDDSAKKLVEEETTDYIVLTNNTTTLEAGKFYVVKGKDVQTGSLTVNGTEGSPTWLILADGAKLTVTGENGSAGINVASDKALIITGQSGGTGKLMVTGGDYGAAIGGNDAYLGNDDADCGTVTINGGTINATGGELGAGIGGGYYGDGGTVTINGGTVNATGSNGAAGIGSGYSEGGEDGSVTINGGVITATGGNGAAGIAGTVTFSESASFAVKAGSAAPGSVVAEGTYARSHTQKYVHIEPETSIKYMAWDASRNELVEESTGDFIKVTNNTTTLEAGKFYVVKGEDVQTGSLTVNGTEESPTWLILADGAQLTVTGKDGAGINVASDKALIITGQSGGTGKLMVTGGSAGIGGEGGIVTINGGEITATGDNGAGIGGGDYGDGISVTINGGEITATGDNGAGIGGDGGIVTINGGVITTTGGSESAGIVGTVAFGEGVDCTVMAGAAAPGDKVAQRDYEDSHTQKYAHIEPEAVEYMDWDDSAKELVKKETNIYTKVTNNTTTLEAGKFYVVKGSDVRTGTLTVNGTEGSPTWLILTDGAKLTARGEEDSGSAGIDVASDKALIITGQSGGTGRLIANGDWGPDGLGAAGIGGGLEADGGSVTINGGKITAAGSGNAAGIGGGWRCDGGTVTINGGTVNAIGDWAAGIGGGQGGDGGDVTINGGDVTATCDGEFGAGIGGGNGGAGGSVTITGGTVTATGGPCSAGIGGGGYNGNGGTVTITGGDVTAIGGDSASGIGGGDGGAGGSVTITGGTVEAICTYRGVGIDGEGCSVTIDGGSVTAIGSYAGINCSGGSVTINDGEVTATSIEECAGIGGGYNGNGGTVTINGGTVTATGGEDGAGIGGGHSGAGGSITINGGTVNATGGDFAAGIGGGSYGGGGTITITGGTVNATGGDCGAGIGGGDCGGGGTVTITGGVITATGDENGAGIGGGNGGGGNVTITGGTVNAIGGDCGAGIGCGCGGSDGTVTIDGGVITATGGDWGAGIGGGASSRGISVTINGGEITATGGKLGMGIGSGYFEDGDGEDGTVTFGEGVFFTVMAGDRAPGEEVTQAEYAASHDQAYVHIEPVTSENLAAKSIPDFIDVTNATTTLETGGDDTADEEDDTTDADDDTTDEEDDTTDAEDDTTDAEENIGG